MMTAGFVKHSARLGISNVAKAHVSSELFSCFIRAFKEFHREFFGILKSKGIIKYESFDEYWDGSLELVKMISDDWLHKGRQIDFVDAMMVYIDIDFLPKCVHEGILTAEESMYCSVVFRDAFINGC